MIKYGILKRVKIYRYKSGKRKGRLRYTIQQSKTPVLFTSPEVEIRRRKTVDLYMRLGKEFVENTGAHL